MRKLIVLTIVLMVLISNLSFACDNSLQTEDGFLELSYRDNYTNDNGITVMVVGGELFENVTVQYTFLYYHPTFENFETFDIWYNPSTDCLYIYDPINEVVVFDDMDL